MNIAVVAETAPAKTLIPIIEKTKSNIYSYTHSDGALELLTPYSTDIKSIGKGRRSGAQKRSNFTIGRLVLQDTLTTFNALRTEDIDLVLTCGNAGDVRKGITAANRLNIPTLHIEQDIYNPIEMIAFANIITVPNSDAQKKLKKLYGITNTINIKGYPQAEYVSNYEITDKQVIYEYYGIDDFYVLFLGGDTKASDIPEIIHETEKLDKTILIIPYRFDEQYVSKFITRENVFVISGFVDLISLMNASCGVIYCAGMGVTIEVASLSVPALKIKGFHTEHASNDLAQSLAIDVIHPADIPTTMDGVRAPNGTRLIENGCKASQKVADLIRDFDMFEAPSGGVSSMHKIWNQRKQYR